MQCSSNKLSRQHAQNTEIPILKTERILEIVQVSRRKIRSKNPFFYVLNRRFMVLKFLICIDFFNRLITNN